MSHGESHPLYIFYSSPNCIFTRRHSFDTHERFLFQFKSHNLISSYPGVIVTSHVFLFSEGIKWTTALKYFQSMLRYWEMLIACWRSLFWFGCAGVKIALFIDNVGFYFARIVFRLPAYLWCPWELDAGAVWCARGSISSTSYRRKPVVINRVPCVT